MRLACTFDELGLIENDTAVDICTRWLTRHITICSLKWMLELNKYGAYRTVHKALT